MAARTVDWNRRDQDHGISSDLVIEADGAAAELELELEGRDVVVSPEVVTS